MNVYFSRLLYGLKKYIGKIIQQTAPCTSFLHTDIFPASLMCTVLVSQGCHNKSPTRWFKKKHIHLFFHNSGGQKSAIKCQQRRPFLETLRKILFHVSLRASGGYQHSLVFHGFQLHHSSFVVLTWQSSLSLCLHHSLFSKRTQSLDLNPP